MDETDKKNLPGYLEVQSGDTLYKVTSIFADKCDFSTLWEELLIGRILRSADCKSA